MTHGKFWGALAAAALVGLSACEPGDQEIPVDRGGGGTGGFGAAAGSDVFQPMGAGIGVPCAKEGPGFGRGAASAGNGAQLSPEFNGPLTVSQVTPPPISGGTLFTSTDGKMLIASDPDREAVYVIDTATRTLVRRIDASGEPGRIVQDKSGKVHVALRKAGKILSFALAADAPTTRSDVCDLPRGMAYDGAADRLYVACAEGALVQMEPATLKPIKKIDLGRDLRDVIARDQKLFVTRFRSAELLSVDMNGGRVVATKKPPTVLQPEEVFVNDTPPGTSSCGPFSGHTESRTNAFLAEVAWRAIDVPGRGVAMLHQRAGNAEVRVSPGGYGGGAQFCAPGVVHGAITMKDDASLSVDISNAGLFVDIAADPTGALLAVANPGGYGTPNSVMVIDAPTVEQSSQGEPVPCSGPRMNLAVEGQATAVTFVSPWMVAVQEREPAAISFFDVRTGALMQKLDLKEPSRYDTGHILFHLTTGSGLACASCHAEAGDDGHVWTFQGIGPRRTQSLRGGFLGSEPFHWNGDMRDFSQLVTEVFNRRMAAPIVSSDQATALAKWIDVQPSLQATAADANAVARGKVLFESTQLGCTTCHNGPQLRRNEGADVGTGALLQVPSLRGISFRAPFMHDGCAPSLADRFGTCGGGDKHGHTSDLKAEQIGDLVAYLDSL